MAALFIIPPFRGASATTTPRMMGAGRDLPRLGTGTPLISPIRDASCPAGPSRRAAGRPSVALGAPAARAFSPRIRAAQLVASHRSMRRVTQNAPDLSALAAAARVAADDALALAARTDHLTHMCGESAGPCQRGMADAIRAHAEDLDRGAVFLDRCAAIPGLPAMISAIESGTTFVPTSATTARSVVVVGQNEAANGLPLRDRVAAGLLRRLRGVA
ncbi:hypothetical protein ABIE45_004564 [Methylobacterium sp. OAE515]|uniref:hypothetical protein n=1 Tax=Methylobacterium sp. OAE515 TaxID=2817895 RepID=UPI00178A3EAB